MSAANYDVMAQEAFAVAYVTIVCATVLLWDALITLGDEITKMWPFRFSIPSMLYFINRYIVVSMLVFNGIASSQTHLKPGFCVFYLRWLVVTITVTQASIEGLLLSRVWALYAGNTAVLCLAVFLYAAGTLTLTGLTIKDYLGEPVLIVQDFSSLPGCYAASVPPIIAGYWIAPVIIESVFFGLVIWRAFSWWRTRSSAPPTLVLMARDSTIYFAVIFVLLILNLFVFEYAPPFLSSLFVTPSNTVGCIAGSRMLLNLRGLARPTLTDMEMSTHIRFSGHRGKKPVTDSTGLTGTTYTNTELDGSTDYEQTVTAPGSQPVNENHRLGQIPETDEVP